MKKPNTDLVELEKQKEDAGFGSRATSPDLRLVNENGDFNVKKIGQSFYAKANIFHRLITMSLPKLAVIIFLFYVISNLFFACIYYSIGIENLQGIDNKHGISDFWEAFFFSSQTLTTLGYGRVSPTGYMANIVSSIEALLGLLLFSITTGILYGRFSKPTPKVLYSKNLLIAPYLDIKGLMIRLVNEKSNQLINVDATIIFSKNIVENGETKRTFKTLKLERSFVKYFSMSWTIVHPITEDSPIFNETAESLAASNAQFLISIDGINDTFADAINSRKSYMHHELLWDYKFISIIEPQKDYYQIDLSKLDMVEKV